MRNLKRALSLTLASVMLLGMMVVGTSAASYPDVDDNDNVEAIEVLSAVGVIVGDNGNFKPDAPVTRNEMAVIMTNMMGLNANDFAGACPFTDVMPWAQNYVAACYANGIIAGRSATIFDGQATVTATEAAAMMMRALGYFQYAEDYSNNGGFTTATVKQAASIRLFSGVAGSANSPMNRNDVAQLALNTLEADVVETTGSKGMEIDMGDGKTVNVGYTIKYEPKVDTYGVGGYDYSNDNPGTGVAGQQKTHQQEYLQLCEKLYDGKLRKTSGATDDLGRPATKWLYDGKDVVSAPKAAAAVFTAETSAADVAKALNGYKLDQDGDGTGTATVAINDTTKYTGTPNFTVTNVMKATDKTGTAARGDLTVGVTGAGETTAKAIADETANGKLVEVYAGNDNVVTDIVTVTYELAKVSGIIESNTRTTYTFGDAETEASATNYTQNYYNYVDETVDDTIAIHGSIAEKDYVTLVKIKDVLHVYPTTNFTGAQSAYNAGKNTIVVGGTTYNVARGVFGVTGSTDANYGEDFPNSNDDANYYVDQFGFVVKTDAIESETNYAVVDRIALMGNSGTGSNKYAEAILVMADGTSKTVKVVDINGTEAKNFAVGSGANSGSLDTKSAAEADGSIKMDSVTISETWGYNTQNLCNRIVKYTVSGDEYKLTYLDLVVNQTGTGVFAAANQQTVTGTSAADAAAVTKGVPAFGDNSKAGTNSTVYIVKTIKANDPTDYSFKAYTGYQNVPTVTSVKHATSPVAVNVVFTEKDNKVAVVYISTTDANSVGETKTGDMFYMNADLKITKIGSGSDAIYEVTGILNGVEDQTIQTKDETYFAGLAKGNLYELSRDDDGKIKSAPVIQDQTDDSKAYTKLTLTSTSQEANGSGNLAGKAYDENTKVIVISENKVVGGGVDSARNGDTIYYKVVDKNGTAAEKNTIEVLYIVKAETVAAPVGTSAKLVVTLTYSSNPTWAAGDTVKFTGTGLNVTATAAVSGGNTTWAISGEPTGYTGVFDGAKLTLTKTATGAVNATSPFGAVTVAVKNAAADITATANETGNTGTWTDGDGSATAAKLEATLTYTKGGSSATPTWAANDTVAFSGTNLTITFKTSDTGSTWTVSDGAAPTGYTATFDGSKLTVTKSDNTAVGGTGSPFGALTVTVTNAAAGITATADGSGNVGVWTDGV